MREALHIFRKDVRHLWPRIAVWLGLLTALGWLDSTRPARTPSFSHQLVALVALYLVVVPLLIASVIHAEELTGNRRYWVTRPFSWRSLLLAKGLFLVVFLDLPVSVMQSAVLASNGLNTVDYLQTMLAGKASSLVYLAMGIALASITKDLGQFVTWLILGFASQAIVTILLTDHVRGFAVSQSWDTPFVFLAQAVVMAATAGIVCWLQYSSRATGRSRCVCIGGLLAMALLPFVLPLGAINEYLVRFSAPVADSVARLSLDSPRELSSIPNWSWDPRHRYYHLPIDVAGIPWGMHAASEYVAVTLTAPNGETWSSGWNAPNEIHSGQATGEGRVLRGDGKYWLYMEVPHSFNDRFVSVPVHLRARATFTLLGVPQIARVRTDGQSQRLPGGRFCGNEWRDRFLSATCLAPFRKPAEATLRFRFPDTGKMEEHGSSGDGLMVNSVWTVIASASEQVKGPVNVTLETREVVGRFERVLDAAGVRLSEYMQ